MNSNDSAEGEANGEQQQLQDDEVIDNGIVFMKGRKMVYYQGWADDEDVGE